MGHTHAGMRAMFAFTLSHYTDTAGKCQETCAELHRKKRYYNLLNMLMKESAWTDSGDVALFMACSTAAAVQEWMTGICQQLIYCTWSTDTHTFLAMAFLSFLRTHPHNTTMAQQTSSSFGMGTEILFKIWPNKVRFVLWNTLQSELSGKFAPAG